MAGILRLLFLACWVIAAWKWSDWKNWRKYYPTLLFWIIGNEIYCRISQNYPLWELSSPILNSTVSNLALEFIAFPASGLLFLSKFPASKGKVQYLIKWALLYWVIELIYSQIGLIVYSNGWNIWWSAAFDLVMFPLLRVHYKNPPLAWVLSVVLALGISFGFGIPYSSLK